MILALDTSCYMTSAALMAADGRLLSDKRRLLNVPAGSTGLRQADALYQHFSALPELLAELLLDVDVTAIDAVAAATRPRSVEGSFMPVFEAAANYGKVLSLAWGKPLYAFSHQDGHLAAALWSLNLNWSEPFLSVHLSGGTTELLLVQPRAAGFDVQIVGSSDLPAGQFVDRVGVALGLPFPAGPELEKLAAKAVNKDLRLKTAIKDTQISFTGSESAAQRLIKQGVDGAELAHAVFANIGRSLAKAIQQAAEQSGCKKVLLAGGVAANEQIKRQVSAECRGLEVHFAPPAYTGDNAVGIAVLGVGKWHLGV